MFLAALAAGCSKDDTFIESGQTPLRIFASTIENNGSKVAFDPSGEGTVPFASSWIDNELVKLNGVVYKIAKDETSGYYGLKDINSEDFIMPLAEEMRALYPGDSYGDNVVEVSADGKSIILHRLGIHFLAGGKQSMAFPMVATATAQSQALLFNHLSAGVQLTLRNTTGSAVNVASLTIVAQSNGAVVNLGIDHDDDINDTIARWTFEGPFMPTDSVGQSGDEVDVKYASVMNFDLKDDVNSLAYKTIENGGSLQLCVPITISSLSSLKVTGYDENGVVVFSKHKSFSSVSIIRNQMYALPEIVF